MPRICGRDLRPYGPQAAANLTGSYSEDDAHRNEGWHTQLPKPERCRAILPALGDKRKGYCGPQSCLSAIPRAKFLSTFPKRSVTGS